MLKANHGQKSVWIHADMDSGLRRNNTAKGEVSGQNSRAGKSPFSGPFHAGIYLFTHR
jgi:hypothetical protein